MLVTLYTLSCDVTVIVTLQERKFVAEVVTASYQDRSNHNCHNHRYHNHHDRHHLPIFANSIFNTSVNSFQPGDFRYFKEVVFRVFAVASLFLNSSSASALVLVLDCRWYRHNQAFTCNSWFNKRKSYRNIRQSSRFCKLHVHVSQGKRKTTRLSVLVFTFSPPSCLDCRRDLVPCQGQTDASSQLSNLSNYWLALSSYRFDDFFLLAPVELWEDEEARVECDERNVKKITKLSLNSR